MNKEIANSHTSLEVHELVNKAEICELCATHADIVACAVEEDNRVEEKRSIL